MSQLPSSTTPSAKEELRRDLRTRRTVLSSEERQTLSRAAADASIASPPWQQARTVALYMSVRGEIDTAPLLVHAWESGKAVLLPACSRKERGKMCFLACAGTDSLCTGPFGIPEPPLSDEESEFLHLSEDDCADSGEVAVPNTNGSAAQAVPNIIIVPGLAFDAKGTRLGMGGGYYDRLLSLPRFKNSLRLGFAYSFQLIDHLPRDAWDVPVHAVCTEQGILWTDKQTALPVE